MSLTRLDRQYGTAIRGVWTATLGRTSRAWTNLGSWRDGDVRRFQRTALPIVFAGQRRVASLTATYLEQTYREIDGGRRVDLDFDKVTGRALRDVDPEDVYRRPFKEIWNALDNGVAFDVALDRGTHRLETVTKTDLQLARTHTFREVTAHQDGVEYYIRELRGEYDCALCLIASTQRYHKKDLMPIHPGCDCEPKTVRADYDPGQVIDEEKLERIHELVEEALGKSDRGGRAVDYRKIIVANDHGEIGPVLGYAGQRFTGPDDIKLPT
ncbi:hypothetical protein [Streptomyces sp. or20]|uniref:hypothetical protein n=1 Tax=Streptomyces sp. or20 TaxID=1828016 RepID=UPI000BEF4FE0|nr:hypothetical protein [Streptomyces sp. or20]